MIEISCPSCGAPGRVPNNKKDSRLNCKKCLVVFHLSPSGTPLLGEPPATKKDTKEPERKIREAPVAYGSSQSSFGLGAALSQIKLPSARVVGIVAGVALLGLLIYFFSSRQSLETRTRMIAKAIGTCDVKTIAEIAVADADMNAMLWTQGVYEAYGDVKLALGGMTPGVKVDTVPPTGGDEAKSIIIFSAEGAQGSMPGIGPPPESSKSKGDGASKQSLRLTLYWTQDTLGNWLFDAKRTRDAAK
jgi:hypothetical protein